MGVGILAMHMVALTAWHIQGSFECNAYGMAVTSVLGLGLSVLAVNGAKGQGYLFARPVAITQLSASIAAAARFERDRVRPSRMRARPSRRDLPPNWIFS